MPLINAKRVGGLTSENFGTSRKGPLQKILNCFLTAQPKKQLNCSKKTVKFNQVTKPVV